METCYKVFRREVIQSVTIEEDRFGFEPEITAKLARRHCVFYEVGDQLLRPDLRRGQEDRAQGCLPGDLRDRQILVPEQAMTALLSFVRRYTASFAVYFLIGGLSALVEWAAFYAALSLLGMHYIPASACGFAVATYVNYLLSARIGFKKGKRSTGSEVALIYAVSGIGFLINVAFMAGVVEVLGLPVMLGKIGGTGIAFIWNFGARQFCVFDKEPRWKLGREGGRKDKSITTSDIVMNSPSEQV